MVDGRLDAEGVAELERVVTGLSGPPRLDLAGLRSVDEVGLGAAARPVRSRHRPDRGVSVFSPPAGG